MEFIRVQAGVYAANCYIIYCEDQKEGIIVDPGGDADDIIAKIEELEWKVKYIVLTHGHGNHCGGEIVESLHKGASSSP